MSTLPEIKASRVVLCDPQGRERIVLALADDGEPSIRLLDRNGGERARLALTYTPESDEADAETAAELALTGSNEHGRVSLSAAEAGGRGIAVIGASGTPRGGANLTHTLFEIFGDVAEVSFGDKHSGLSRRNTGKVSGRAAKEAAHVWDANRS